MSRSRALAGAAAKGGLVLALALSVGGYTVAESATQQATVEAEQTQQRAVVEAHREAVAAERQRAVATGQDAVADAEAVRTVAASTVSEADLAPLTAAVDRLSALLSEAPTAPIAPTDGADAAVEDAAADDVAADDVVTDAATDDAAAVDRSDRASRATGDRGPAPTTGTQDAPQATATPAADGTGADPDGAAPAAADAAAPEQGAGTSGTAAPATSAPATAAPTSDVATDPGATPETTTGPGGIEGATEAPAPADDAAPEDDLSAEILAAVATVTEQTARVQAAADAALAAQQAAAAAQQAADASAAQAAAAAAAEAAAKEAQRVSLDAYANGRVPADALCDLAVGGGHQLRCDAAEAFAALDAAYTAEFGESPAISDSYRSYAAQVACRRVKGYLCAVPGTSNHGRGVAVDLAGGVETFGTRQHRWMAANAGDFGWDLPDWASSGGSKPEPWHWEFIG
ncbi:M15 family metallopeptidase [Cellulomonas aerilata]|uniref:M15 family metallopeptidase n=1 Tax=Cellulomonas aerilata TaxID=515326 RepID=UPI001649F6B7|nr:M15 family metallopeptidase [Cellulomonas aerilata]